MHSFVFQKRSQRKTMSASKFSRELKKIHNQTFSIKAGRRSKAFAMDQYSGAMHIPLMALAMICRRLLASFPELGSTGVKVFYINAHQSVLFRSVDTEKKRNMTMECIRQLMSTVSTMHVHNLTGEPAVYTLGPSKNPVR